MPMQLVIVMKSGLKWSDVSADGSSCVRALAPQAALETHGTAAARSPVALLGLTEYTYRAKL